MTESKPQNTTEVAAATRQWPRRLDPVDLFEDLQADMARLWGQTFSLLPHPIPHPQRRAAPAMCAWQPATDVYKQDGKLMVKAELPGVKKENINVSLEQGNLVITSERHAEHEVTGGAYHREERVSGRFYRRIPLNFEVKPDHIQARYADGVLEIQVPMPAQEHSPAEKIAVQ